MRRHQSQVTRASLSRAAAPHAVQQSPGPYRHASRGRNTACGGPSQRESDIHILVVRCYVPALSSAPLRPLDRQWVIKGRCIHPTALDSDTRSHTSRVPSAPRGNQRQPRPVSETSPCHQRISALKHGRHVTPLPAHCPAKVVGWRARAAVKGGARTNRGGAVSRHHRRLCDLVGKLQLPLYPETVAAGCEAIGGVVGVEWIQVLHGENGGHSLLSSPSRLP